MALFMVECFLCVVEKSFPKTERFMMPPEWAQVRIPGTHNYYWQGHLHRYNSLKFRGDEWSAKRPDTLRIAVLGDSLTYGYGVAEKLAYPALIEKKLRSRYRLEVLNLGHSGAQSEDIDWAAHTFFPLLHPDIVLYGICLNDYLPSGQGEYQRIGGYFWSDPTTTRTRVEKVLRSATSRFLMKAGIEHDFMKDALDASTHYAQRFRRDVADLNNYVLSQGCPPVVAMVVNQTTDKDALRLCRQTEQILREAGLLVIPAENYLQKWEGRPPLVVSRWEGHPNVEAHEAFAHWFTNAIENTPVLRQRLNPYKKNTHEDPAKSLS